MNSADPLNLPLATYLLVLGVAVAGGLVGYLNKSAFEKLSWGQALIVAFTSGFLGFLAFCICLAKGWTMPWTLVTVGVIGLMGKRAIVDIQNVVRIRLGLLPAEQPNSERVQNEHSSS